MSRSYYLTVLLMRVMLPAGLILSIALRPFGLSIVYLLLFFISPFPHIPNSKTISGWPSKYLILVILISCLLLLLHIGWHIFLVLEGVYAIKPRTINPIIIRIGHNLGLVSYSQINTLMAVQYLAPEVVMIMMSVVVFNGVKRICADIPASAATKYQRYPLLTNAGKYISLVLIMFSGILRPSVTSGIYYMVFMGAATAWACGRALEKAYAVVCRCLMVMMAVHTMTLIVYQCNYITEVFQPTEGLARYFGLTTIVEINTTTPNVFHYDVSDTGNWGTLVSPLVILFTYYFLAIETRELFKPKAKRKSAITGLEDGKVNGSLVRVISFHRGSRRAANREKWKNATKRVQSSQRQKVAYKLISSKARRWDAGETTPLIRSGSPTTRWPSMRTASGTTRPMHQDSVGSIILNDGNDSVNLDQEPTIMDDLMAAVVDFFQVIVRSSYIATTITMMAWSIMFHSWLTFVFLMWANVVWLCQDQRSFMLRTSPVLVFYAMVLLIAQYVYSMDLTESELPSDIEDFNLAQIGLGRTSSSEPCITLLIKSLFTCMFWVTLRQRVQEMRTRRQSAAITDMAAPLQLTVSAAASVIEAQKDEESRSRLMRIIGQWLRYACARYWIYVVVIMLFVIGISGERMTMFRIIYMSLFLAFILMFQISFYWWRRLMYIFWIVVIVYSMINLILIYVYQFDNFSKIIERYLLINERLQNDLGLEPYHPADLFVKLLTPTCFLVITIMQVHYFHKDFMEFSDPNKGSSSDIGIAPVGESTVITLPETSEPETTAEDIGTATNDRYRSGGSAQRSVRFNSWVALNFTIWRKRAIVVTEKVIIFLNIHLMKIIMLSLMLMCVFNVCAMHVPIMFIICPAILMARSNQRASLIIVSILISIYFMAKMIYQIEYIKHATFDVNCTTDSNSSKLTTTYNNAEWIGFRKASPSRPLVVLLQDYIALIALLTFKSLVSFNQRNSPSSHTKHNLMFPGITRKDADKNLINCMKYLFNYGFYKFGVEISLICLMAGIGSRMDVYSLLYAVWLLVLVSVKRPTQAKLWKPFTAFIIVAVPLQYVIAVGLYPRFCVNYIWSGDTQQMKHLRNWMYLPYQPEPPHATKLIFDYFLLMFASRQLDVFKHEKNGDDSNGGSNEEEIGTDWETANFVNPVPDFLGFVGTWLDVIKRMVFLGMLWVTLAIMFMTGTNRVNLFSMGYLIGSFIFLWQGTDFYLLPKEAILQWWSWLLRYNVSVVVFKTFLQIPGCIFSSVMQAHACWLVQLLGIGCVDKFAGGNIAQFLKMNYVKDATCSVSQEDIGLAWDGVCFAFLILQRRLFLSYYFYRIIDESKATTVLASRGAELIEQLRQKQMKIQEDQEIKILEKIKVKMERIKANQRKIQGVLAKEPRHHDGEEDEEEEDTQEELAQVPLVRGDSDASGRGYHTPDSPGPASPRGFHTPISELESGSDGTPGLRHRIYEKRHEEPDQPAYRHPASHVKAVRSGDYYMFEEFDDTDDLKEGPEKADSDDEAPQEMGLGKLLSTVIKTDLRHALSIRRASAPTVRTHRSSRHEIPSRTVSVPLQRPEPDRPGPSRMTDDPDSTLYDDMSAIPPEDETWFEKLSRFVESIWAFASSFIVTLTRYLMRFSRDYRYVSRTLTLEKKVLKEFASSFIVTLTRYLMRFSRDYRYVSRTLTLEKKVLKEKQGFGIGLREGSQMRWEPLPEALQPRRKLSEISVPEIRILAPSMERGLDETPPSHRHSAHSAHSALSARSPSPVIDDDTSEHESAFSLESSDSKDVTALEEQDDSMFKHERCVVVHLLYAIWYAVLAHTDIVCYIMVFINQIQSATILSIPLPLMVFLWGTLTIPRPTKTFWVTLIAYTEVIVLIKSMFQFEILPWNQKVIPANMPFTAPRIIGIERKNNYALYDLLLLLIIFLHRFMLKSLGLWKEATPDIELREDKTYHLKPEDIEMLVEGRGVEVGEKYVKLHDTTGPARESAAMPSRPSGSTDETDNTEERSQRDGFKAILDSKEQRHEGEHKHHKDGEADEEPVIAVTTTLEDVYDHYPRVLWLTIKRYLQPAHQFFQRMLAPGARVTADVYAYMFLCDFFNFLVVIFGFAAFGTHQGDGGVQAYLEENKVPIAFLVMLILQFALIVIDRALYLRKFMLGKILFQYALIIGVHVWMFFVLPFITERTFNALIPPPMWYMVKCVYLLLSAYQIRCGYPRRIIGNFLCKSYRFVNMILFRGFMAVPFVFELRTLMDWIWTDTSMTLMDWLKMEDIFANVFLLKCSRSVEDEFPQPRGSKKSTTSKYLLGGGVLTFVIAIIWFPLVFFAFGNTVGEPNPPTDVTVKIRIGPFLPIYQMSAQVPNIEQYTEQEYTQLTNLYARDRTAQTFLSNYMYNDVAVVRLSTNSIMEWTISPPELQRLEAEVASNNSLKIKFTFVITHPSNAAQNPPTIEDSREIKMEPYIDATNMIRNPERTKLHNMLVNKTLEDTWVRVDTLFPKFLKVFNKGIAKPAYQLTPATDDNEVTDKRLYRNVFIRLDKGTGTGINSGMYWKVKESCSTTDRNMVDQPTPDRLDSIPLNNCDGLVMYTFNDKLFPETLNFISGSGIIGLYTTFVFLASRVIRGFFSGIYTKIMFDDLPNVDRVLQLSLDIYLVREALELALEEDLFAKLVFLYRSPETLIKWSRPKEEEEQPPPALPSPR